MLLVGIDGATLRVVDALVQRGELPEFERLMREGVRGVLPQGLSYQIRHSSLSGADPSAGATGASVTGSLRPAGRRRADRQALSHAATSARGSSSSR